MAHSLSAGEIAYRFNIDSNSAYLLDSSEPGDQMSIYLRTLETDKDKKLQNGVVVESGKMSGTKHQQYVLTASSKKCSGSWC